MSLEICTSCECGAITFISAEQPVVQICCHCNDCRDATQNDYSNIAFFKLKSTQLLGDTQSKTYKADSGNATNRESCTRCGSVMFDKSVGFPGLIGVFSHQIQPPFSAKVDSHVWVQSKSPNTIISAEVAAYEKGLT